MKYLATFYTVTNKRIDVVHELLNDGSDYSVYQDGVRLARWQYASAALAQAVQLAGYGDAIGSILCTRFHEDES